MPPLPSGPYQFHRSRPQCSTARKPPGRWPSVGWGQPLSSAPCRQWLRGSGRESAVSSAVREGGEVLAAGGALTSEEAERLGAQYQLIVSAVQEVLLADDSTVQLAVGCLLAEGHLL